MIQILRASELLQTDRGTTTTNHHAMKRTIVIAASLALVWGAPQFLTDNIRSNCRSEVTTVFEETETETVNKVICQTEFREECNAKVSDVCRNVTTGEVECQNIEKFECVDSITNKCGIEKVLKNVSYTETVCRNKLENIICVFIIQSHPYLVKKSYQYH